MTLESGGPIGAAHRPMRDLTPRLLSALVLAAAALTALWRGSDLFVGLWLIAALAVFWEWQTLIGAPARAARLTIGWIAVAAAAVFARRTNLDLAWVTLVVAAALVALAAGAGRRLWAAAGVFYAGSLVVAAIALRLSLDGFNAILWLFAVVWGTDVMAYFGGRLIGGPKLWPRVSPGKTWSGFLVGVASGAVVGLAVLALGGGLARGAWFGVLAMGLAAATVAQGGDLFESAFKRRFDAKDSSRLIPGHGGVMDRLDGFIAAVVFAAIVGWSRNGSVELAIGVLRW